MQAFIFLFVSVVAIEISQQIVKLRSHFFLQQLLGI